MNKRAVRWVLWIVFLSGILAGAAVLSLYVGAVNISFKKMFSSVIRGGTGVEGTIFFHIRLPRVLLAVICGGGLSVAGVVFQALFRNPLVEPYTLGVSGGAALAVALCIIPGWYLILPAAGFIGALISILLVYLVSIKYKRWDMNVVLLTGVMFSFVTSSCIMLVMALSRTEQLHGIIFWIMGSLAESGWKIITVVWVITMIAVLITYFFSYSLNAISLGEEEALHLGVNVELVKKILFLLASLITGCLVAVTGIIGFIGLVVPHIVRMVVGRDHRILLPAAFLGGGIFLLISDTIARVVIAPRELPVGVVTGIIGGIVFIYFLAHQPLGQGGK